MKLIAHRGNFNGKHEIMENNPEYLRMAVRAGYDIEVDVWVTGDGIFLGHDGPQYAVTEDDLLMWSSVGWFHAKNLPALELLLRLGLNCFFHDTDDFTLTSKGYIWTHSGKSLSSKSISVMDQGLVPISCAGVCRDDFTFLDVSS